ncbi:MAG: cytochrome C oxidase Cbb3, partial [Chitinophagaceae bacterium]
FNHMMDPTSMSPGSIMPPYPWLIQQTLDVSTTPAKIRAMQTLGVPYRDGFASEANDKLKIQADEIAKDLKQNNINVKSDKEIIALIAYLQRMGTDIKANRMTIPSNQ